MSKQTPFTIKIFVADGDPDGLRVVERSNWTGKGHGKDDCLAGAASSRNNPYKTGVNQLARTRRNAGPEVL